MRRTMVQPGSPRFRALSLIWVLGMILIGIVALMWLAHDHAEARVQPPTVHQSPEGSTSSCVPTDFSPPLTVPWVISDTFGPRLIRRYDFHRGIDWTDYTTAPVHAVTTGTVRSFRNNWTPDMGTGSGNFVHLTHEDIGCETRYSHLVKVSDVITEGLQVTPGQIIGWVGDTGASYPHLHFEVRQGINVSQRAAIHPLSTPFLLRPNNETPTVTLLGVYTDATDLTALVEVTSPYMEPDVSAVSVAVSGAVTDSRTIDYVDLNASATVVAHLDAPYVNDVCMIPYDLNAKNDYRVTMVFRGLNHGPAATVTAQVFDVGGKNSMDTAVLTRCLEVTPSNQIARGVPGQMVSFVYTLTNRTGTMNTFTLTHLSAQGWQGAVIPATATLDSEASITATVKITLNTDTFGPFDCGLLKVVSQNSPQQVTAGSYRIYRDAYVSAETGNDAPGCGSMGAPCATITYALGQTDAGGTIHVAQGTYTENLTLTKTVNLLGGYATDWSTRTLAPYVTTVDGGGIHTVLVVDGDYGPLLEGFTFINGHRHNGAGGGVRFVGGAAPTLRSNWILNNTADKSGGGIYIGSYGTLSPTIISNTIAGNIAKSKDGGGGGIYVTARPALIQGNVISSNHAISSAGGGIYLTGDTTAQVLGNWIEYNEAANEGGGVLVRSSGVRLVNNSIWENMAYGDGNGIRVAGESAPYIYHNTLLNNHPESGAGLYIGTGSVPTVANNIVANHALGVYCGSQVPVSCSVLNNIVNLDGCLDSGNIYADPHLIDQVRLAPDSPAIDACAYVGVDDDIFGQPRPAYSGYDSGAYEFHSHDSGVIITPASDAIPGDPASDVGYTLTVTNTGTTTDTFDVSLGSNDWPTVAPLTIGPLGSGVSTTLGVTVSVPLGTQGGISDTVILTCTSQNDDTISDSSTLTTTANQVAPVLTLIDNQTVVVGHILTFTATASDANADTLTFSLDAGAPEGAVLDPITGEFTWTPVAAGVYTATVRVADDGVPPLDDTEAVLITVEMERFYVYLPLLIRNQ
jgi:hypothetical protein